MRRAFWREARGSESSSSESMVVVVGERRWEMGREEFSGTERLERVVRRRRVEEVVADEGRRLSSSSTREEMGVVGGRARDRVGGRPAPAKLVTRTLILLRGAIVLLSADRAAGNAPGQVAISEVDIEFDARGCADLKGRFIKIVADVMGAPKDAVWRCDVVMFFFKLEVDAIVHLGGSRRK